MRFSYKIKITVFILGILTLTSCFRSNQVKIKGVLKNCKNQTLYLEKVDVFKVRLLDSMKMKNSGRFAFATSAKYPDFYQLRISDDKLSNFYWNLKRKLLSGVMPTGLTNHLILKDQAVPCY